jgi:putative Holliday junction resolvase
VTESETDAEDGTMTVRRARSGARAVGLDLGSRRIGVAVSDSSGTMAFPRPMIPRTGDRNGEHRAIADVVAESGASVVVVGLPLGLDGKEGRAAHGARQEASALGKLFDGRDVSVELFDERLTTVTADRALLAAGKKGPSRRSSVDSAAAAVILQAWLESR